MINERARKFAEALVSAKIMTREQLETSIVLASKKEAPSLVAVLLDQGFLSFKIFEKFLFGSAGIKTVIIGERKVEPDVLALVDRATIERNLIFPIEVKISQSKKLLLLGMVDPIDTDTLLALKKKTETDLVIALISLPDFRNAVSHHFKNEEELVTLTSNTSNTELLINRPGGYEEEMVHLQQPSSNPKQSANSNGNENRFFQKEPAKNKYPNSAYFGSQETRTRDEIVAKLDLASTGSSTFEKDKYARDTLFKELGEVELGSLAKVYDQCSFEQKFEGLLNALIHKGLLSKRDLLNSAAISFIFGEKQT